MRGLVRLLGGLVGAFAGFAAGALVSYLIMGWLGVSDFEGERATTAAILFGPIGGLIGIVLGAMLALRLTAGTSRAGTVLWSGLTLIVLIAVAGAGLGLAWLGSDRPLGHNGAVPRLLFEVRIPHDVSIADDGRGVRVTLDTDRNQMPAEMTGIPADHVGEWLVLAGEVELYYRTAQRLLVVDLGNGKQHIFDLGLPASPSESEEWGPWRRVDYVFTSPGQQSATPPGPEDRSEMRSRVRTFSQ